MDQNITYVKNSKFCKNHSDIPSKYFITDQPWLKYCKDCAFNIALCGKKIQKQLTTQQFDRKMIISSIATEFKKNIQQIEQNNIFFNNLTKMLEQVSKPMQERLQQIQTSIRQLTEAKEGLKEVYHKEIFDRIRQFFEKQSRISINSMEMKRQLQNIESNFGNLIELENNLQFQKNKQIWTKILIDNKKQILDQKEYQELQNKLLENIQHFYAHFDNIIKFKINTTYDKKQQKLSKISAIQQQFNMTLTPIQANSLNGSAILQNIKLNLRSKGQLKLRSNRKINTQRQTKTTSKNGTKRSTVLGSQNVSIEIINKKNLR